MGKDNKMLTKIKKKYTIFCTQIKKISSKRKKQRKILIVGGYGYKNTGDEAQLSSVIQRLNILFPDYFIKILSPNPDYTFIAHNKCPVGEAPRVAFFHQGRSLIYDYISVKKKSIIGCFINEIFKCIFIFKSSWIMFNALLIKSNLPTFLLGAQAAGLLYDLYSSSLLYFAGGGYLTGFTLSRLWDGILMCRLASVFEVPVAMSGQTIGLWCSPFNKYYARKGFKDVKLISLRDRLFSPKSLEEIGITRTHIYPVCDDALFCEYQKDNSIMQKHYDKSFVNHNFIENGYIAVNIHFFGINSTKEKETLIEKLHRLIEYAVTKTSYNILFIPMTSSDIEAMNMYLDKYHSERMRIFRYDYDFKDVRRAIKDSFMCITMKHHPIIFSVGEKTPVISINLSTYYEHKNKGALDILGIEDYSITLEDKNHFEKFTKLFDLIINGLGEINKIDLALDKIKIDIRKYEYDLKALLSIKK